MDGGNNSSQNENEDSDDQQNVADPPSRTHDPFSNQGTIVVEEPGFRLKVKSVSHQRHTRYSLSDHLYSLSVEQKDRGPPPLLINLERGLERALISVLDQLKSVYARNEHYQIYVTIVDRNIKSGLNSGNYSIRTPSDKISRWVIGMLYNYLKSNQTMTLNDSFKIQVKVLSVQHTRDLERNPRRTFRRHVYN